MEMKTETYTMPKSNCMHLSYTFVAIRWRK